MWFHAKQLVGRDAGFWVVAYRHSGDSPDTRLSDPPSSERITDIYYASAGAYGSTHAIIAVSILIAVLLFGSSVLSVRAESVPSAETATKAAGDWQGHGAADTLRTPRSAVSGGE